MADFGLEAVAATPEYVARLRSAAENLRRVAREMMEQALDHDTPSIRWLDGYIERTRLHLDDGARSRLASTIGAFLGECMVRNLSGEWVMFMGMPSVRFGASEGALPITKAAEQLEGGSEEAESASGWNRAKACATPATTARRRVSGPVGARPKRANPSSRKRGCRCPWLKPGRKSRRCWPVCPNG